MQKRSFIETVDCDDSYLLSQVKNGCRQSFDALYEKHWENAYNNAYVRLRDSEQAKDIIQEIFTHIWLKRETLQIENVGAYINVSVRNRVIKIVAKEKVTHPFFRLLEDIPALQVSSDAHLLLKEFFNAYEQVVSTLPDQNQKIFRLRYQEDMSTKDIASHLGLSRKTVQNQLGKAIEKLRPTFFLLQVVLITSYFL